MQRPRIVLTGLSSSEYDAGCGRCPSGRVLSASHVPLQPQQALQEQRQQKQQDQKQRRLHMVRRQILFSSTEVVPRIISTTARRDQNHASNGSTSRISDSTTNQMKPQARSCAESPSSSSSLFGYDLLQEWELDLDETTQQASSDTAALSSPPHSTTQQCSPKVPYYERRQQELQKIIADPAGVHQLLARRLSTVRFTEALSSSATLPTHNTVVRTTSDGMLRPSSSILSSSATSATSHGSLSGRLGHRRRSLADEREWRRAAAPLPEVHQTTPQNAEVKTKAATERAGMEDVKAVDPIAAETTVEDALMDYGGLFFD